jgi:hypothetical protein
LPDVVPLAAAVLGQQNAHDFRAFGRYGHLSGIKGKAANHKWSAT